MANEILRIDADWKTTNKIDWNVVVIYIYIMVLFDCKKIKQSQDPKTF